MGNDIRYVTPLVCSLLGVDRPALCSASVPAYVESAIRSLSKGTLDRVVIYAPDAIGTAFVNDHMDMFYMVRKRSDLEYRVSSMFPSVTPVCFASMFTGAMPAEHGILKYEKPVLVCATLFDLLVSAGKRVLISAVKNSSIHLLFRERPVDYRIEPDDSSATEAGLAAIEQGKHDFILIYNQEYDDTLHATAPASKQAENAALNHVNTFLRIMDSCEKNFSGQKWALLFAPDHGAHYCPNRRKGHHGTDRPEDMEITHFLRISLS